MFPDCPTMNCLTAENIEECKYNENRKYRFFLLQFVKDFEKGTYIKLE